MVSSQTPVEDTVGPEAEVEYTLDYEARCRHCRKVLDVVLVARLLRTRVNFTSTLPRRGHMLACKECKCILSAGLESDGIGEYYPQLCPVTQVQDARESPANKFLSH